MNDGLKQRLVGATVLIALSIILWPIFMGTDQSRHVVLESSISEPPKFERFEIERAKPNANIKPVGSYQKALEKDKANQVSLDDTKVLDNHGLPTSWVIQLGSFGDKANIKRLVKSLRGDKHKVFVETFNKNGNQLSKIFIGPFIELKEANKLKAIIDKKFSLKTTVEKFIP